MTRSGTDDVHKHAQAVQAARQTISRGERPLYRLQSHPDAGGLSAWHVPSLPGLAITAPDRRELLQASRHAIAALLEVPIDAFDVEVLV